MRKLPEFIIQTDKPFFISLRTRIVLLLVSVFVILGCFAALDAYSDYEQLKSDKIVEFNWAAKWIANEAQQHFSNAQRTAFKVMEHIRNKSIAAVCAHGFSGLADSKAKMERFAIVDTDGNVSCNSIPWLRDQNIADKAYFAHALQEYGESSFDEADDHNENIYSGMLSQVMHDDNGHVRKVILVDIDFSDLKNEISKAGLPSVAHLLLVNDEGRVIVASSNFTDWEDKSIGDTAYFRNILNNQDETLTSPGFTGERSLILAHQFSAFEKGMRVIIDIPLKLLLHSTFDNMIRTISMDILGYLLALGLIYYWSRIYLLRKVDSINRAAIAFATGDMTARNDQKDTDELGILAQSFDKMADSLQAREKLIWQKDNLDMLTGLPNRRLFQDRLSQEIMRVNRHKSSIALLLIDLDRFKQVNDTLGHDQGDVLLVEAARRINACVRQSDTTARIDGDEFAVILADFGERMQIDRIAQHVNQALSQPFELHEDNIYVTASIGIALFPDDTRDVEVLIQYSEQAMYRSKESGRNRFNYFTPSMQNDAHEKMALTNDLRNALARNELEVYYQPILDMENGRINKAEALLRWKHPERGMVSPAIFIPLAEESGLILEIGNWVFEQAIARIEHWNNRYGRIIQVSVNKSPAQFEQTAPSPWRGRLKSSGLPGNCITVEITEGLLIKDSLIVKRRLEEFHRNSIEVSIDDFGTGFSALSYLKQFDIDYLKIDRSFVMNLLADDSDKALVKAIITMAHSLEIKTIAEGVETEAQRDILIGFGCDYVQGYLYSRPVPADEFEKLLEDDRLLWMLQEEIANPAIPAK